MTASLMTLQTDHPLVSGTFDCRRIGLKQFKSQQAIEVRRLSLRWNPQPSIVGIKVILIRLAN